MMDTHTAWRTALHRSGPPRSVPSPLPMHKDALK